MTTLRNKVAVITGSARGIGRSVAERYAQLGADIVVNYLRDKDSAEWVVAHLKDFNMKAIAVQADVAQVADVRRLFETAKSTFGKIDIVVADTGVELPGVSVADFTEEQFDRLFTINTKGAYFTLQVGAKYVEDVQEGPNEATILSLVSHGMMRGDFKPPRKHSCIHSVVKRRSLPPREPHKGCIRQVSQPEILQLY